MAVDLQGLAQILEASLDPSKNKQGQTSSSEFSGQSTDLGSGACNLARGEETWLFRVLTPNRGYRNVRCHC